MTPIIRLERPEIEDLEPSKYMDHTCYNTPGDSSAVKYVIKFSEFDFSTPKGWVTFIDLVLKALEGKNATIEAHIYKCMERILKDDTEVHYAEIGASFNNSRFGLLLWGLFCLLFRIWLYSKYCE